MLVRASVTHSTLPAFGTGIVSSTSTGFEASIDYSNIVGYDKKASPAVWKSVTQSTFTAPAEAALSFTLCWGGEAVVSSPLCAGCWDRRACVCVCVGGGC